MPQIHSKNVLISDSRYTVLVVGGFLQPRTSTKMKCTTYTTWADVGHHQPIRHAPVADLGMFSMFGRTGAPTKREPPQKHKKLFHAAIVVCIAARVLYKMSMMTTVRVRWRQSGGGGIHILGAPHFFLNRGPVRSKSGPAWHHTRRRETVNLTDIQNIKKLSLINEEHPQSLHQAQWAKNRFCY